MQVARSSYYAWRSSTKSNRQKENEKLIPLVWLIHGESRKTYGTRRMAKALVLKGVHCGRTRARTLMRLAGIKVKTKRKFKVTTISRHKLPVAPNLVGRNFDVEEPNQVWASDITYIWTHEGWLYLTVTLDLFSREVVGWAMGNRLTGKLVIDALNMAFFKRRPDPGLVHHSDQGSQYCSLDFQKLLASYSMLSSMSRKGDCFDNAVAESFFSTLKTERIFLSNYKTREEAKRSIVEYVEMFYNSRRLHSYLGYVSPGEFEEMWLLEKVA